MQGWMNVRESYSRALEHGTLVVTLPVAQTVTMAMMAKAFMMATVI